MKKIAIMGLGMMLAFGLIGCEKKVEETAPAATETTTQAPATTEAPAATEAPKN